MRQRTLMIQYVVRQNQISINCDPYTCLWRRREGFVEKGRIEGEKELVLLSIGEERIGGA